MCSTHANGTKTKQGSLATHSGCNQWFIYQLSMVPSCDAGCRLLVTWFLASYRVTKCLVTGLSCDSSPLSLNPMRPLVVVSNPTHPARTPTIHLTVTPYFIVTKTNKRAGPTPSTPFSWISEGGRAVRELELKEHGVPGPLGTRYTVFIDFGGTGCQGRFCIFDLKEVSLSIFNLHKVSF